MPWPRILTADEQRTIAPRQGRIEQVVPDSSGTVEAGWAWYEERQGVVAWAFRNSDSSQRSVILLRNSYYFGDAYWAIYASNPGFHTGFIDGRSAPGALQASTVPQNAAPLAPVQFGSLPDPSQTVVCFVFTLPPGQAWAMLERGFSRMAPPSGVAVYDVSPLSGGEFCVAYDRAVVREWDDQTRTRLGAYTPNPSTFNTWLFQAEESASFRRVFPDDSVTAGRCAPTTVPASDLRVPQQSSTETTDMFPPVFPDVLSPPINP